MTDAVVTAQFGGLVDDAALFRPGDAPVAAAVPAPRELRSRVGGPVGPFVVPAARPVPTAVEVPVDDLVGLGLLPSLERIPA